PCLRERLRAQQNVHRPTRTQCRAPRNRGILVRHLERRVVIHLRGWCTSFRTKADVSASGCVILVGNAFFFLRQSVAGGRSRSARCFILPRERHTESQIHIHSDQRGK